MTSVWFPQLRFIPTGPAPQFRVFIFAGQSNGITTGSTTVPVELQTPDPAVTIWNIFTQTWQTYAAGTNSFTSAAGAGSQFGPEGEFARQHRITHSQNVAIIKYGVSSTPIFQQGGSPDDWSPDSTGEYFDITKTEVIAALAALGGTYSIDAVCWMQGETDAQISTTTANAYEANLTAFIAAVRSQWTGSVSTPFHIGRISDSSLWTFRSTVRAAQLAVSDADPLADIISTDTYPLQGDNAHYTEAGVKSLGADFFSAHNGTYVFPG